MSRMGTGSQSNNTASWAEVPAMNSDELAMMKRLQDLGMSQADAVQTVITQTQNPTRVTSLQLSPQDQALVDQAYMGAETNLRRFGNIMGQDLAGTRGLNTSDTPVSEAVLRETLPAFASLQSDKAQQSLGLGLNLANLNEGARQFNLQALLGSASTTPSALGLGLGTLQQDRLARAMNRGAGTVYNNDSILSQMNQGAQFRLAMHQGTNQAAQAGMNGMKMASMMG